MALRTLEEMLVDLRTRVASLERRGIKRPASIPTVLLPGAQWAAKAAPVAFISAYKNSWQRGEGNGGSLDHTSDPNAILVLVTGVYEVHAHQRGGSSSDYVGIALDGDRATLENRVGGVWTHDHSSGGNSFGNSYYMGVLNAGEKITAGPPVLGGTVYGGVTAGALYARRIS